MNRPATKTSKSSIISIAILAIIGIGMLALYQITPLQADDTYFGARWRDYILGLTDAFDWKAYADWIYYEVHIDSPRLFNLLFPLLGLYMPKWIFNILSALICVATVALLARSASVTRRQPLRLAIIALAYMLLMPWDDNMLAVCLTLNYVWEGMTAIAAIWAYFKASTRFHPAALAAIGLVAGAGHEMCAIALAGALSLHALLCRFRLNRGQWAVLGGTLAGCAALMAVMLQGRHSYLSSELATSQALIYNIHAMATHLVLHTPIAVALIAAIVALLPVRRARRAMADLRSPFLVMAAAALAGMLPVVLLCFQSPRIGWFPELMSIAALATLASSLLPAHVLSRRIVARPLLAAAVALLTIHLAVAAVYLDKIARSVRQLNRCLAESDGGNIVCDFLSIDQLPAIAYNKLTLSRTFWEIPSWSWRCDLYYGGPHTFPVPVELLDIDPAKLVPIPGNTPYCLYGPWLVARDGDSRYLHGGETMVHYTYGKPAPGYFYGVLFTDRHGRRWRFTPWGVRRPLSHITELQYTGYTPSPEESRGYYGL